MKTPLTRIREGSYRHERLGVEVEKTSTADFPWQLSGLDPDGSGVIDTVRYGTVIYAAVRSRENKEIFGLVLLAERQRGILYTKPISEDMGPAEDRCPRRILDLLPEPSNDHARQWRERCRAHLAKPRPRKGQTVAFAKALTFTNGEAHSTFTYQGGARFRDGNGCVCHIRCWQELQFTVA